MKAKHRKQRIKKAIDKPSQKPTLPTPAAENGPTDKQISENFFRLPLYVDLLRLKDPTDSNSIFNIEAAMLSNKFMAPNLSGDLSNWITKVQALAASKGGSVLELAGRRELPHFVFPPLLAPQVWYGAWCLLPKSLAMVNACYPGAIYTEQKFVKMLREMTFWAANGDTPEKRNMANDWLRTVLAVPPPPRKQPRRGKIKSKEKPGRPPMPPRSPEIHLSSIHIWAILQLYVSIVKIRKVHAEKSRSTDKLLLVLPELSHVKDRKLEWFNKIVQTRPPSSLGTACEIVARIPQTGLQGHKPESIRRALERQFRKTKFNPIPILEKFARDFGKKLVEEFNKKAVKVSSNSTP